MLVNYDGLYWNGKYRNGELLLWSRTKHPRYETKISPTGKKYIETSIAWEDAHVMDMQFHVEWRGKRWSGIMHNHAWYVTVYDEEVAKEYGFTPEPVLDPRYPTWGGYIPFEECANFYLCIKTLKEEYFRDHNPKAYTEATKQVNLCDFIDTYRRVYDEALLAYPL